MFSSDIPHRLKALRETAGLSIRKLATELGMSSSGYAHYETPARFKDQYLPMQMARDLVRILGAHGVQPDHVMSLAGGAHAQSETRPASGFADNAAHPWTPAPGQRAAMDAAIYALAPTALNPGTFQMSRPVLSLGLLRGDILVIDRKRLPQPGELALANAQIDDDDEMVTVVGRYLPPLIFTAESLTDGQVLDVTSGKVAVYHPILASFRSTGQN